MELARVFGRRRMQSTLVFCCFGGEEQGLQGSRYFVDHFSDIDSVMLMLQIDMANGTGIIDLDPDTHGQSAPRWFVSAAIEEFHNLGYEHLRYPTHFFSLNYADPPALAQTTNHFSMREFPQSISQPISTNRFILHTMISRFTRADSCDLALSSSVLWNDSMVELPTAGPSNTGSSSLETFQFFFRSGRYRCADAQHRTRIVCNAGGSKSPVASESPSTYSLDNAQDVLLLIYHCVLRLVCLRRHRAPPKYTSSVVHLGGFVHRLWNMCCVDRCMGRFPDDKNSSPVSVPIHSFQTGGALAFLLHRITRMDKSQIDGRTRRRIVPRQSRNVHQESFFSKILLTLLSPVWMFRLIFSEWGRSLCSKLAEIDTTDIRNWIAFNGTIIIFFTIWLLPFLFTIVAVVNDIPSAHSLLLKIRSVQSIIILGVIFTIFSGYLLYIPVYNSLWYRDINIEEHYDVNAHLSTIHLKSGEYLSGLHIRYDGTDTTIASRSVVGIFEPEKSFDSSWLTIHRTEQKHRLGDTTQLNIQLHLSAIHRPFTVSISYSMSKNVLQAFDTPWKFHVDRQQAQVKWYSFPDSDLVIPVNFSLVGKDSVKESVEVEFDRLVYPVKMELDNAYFIPRNSCCTIHTCIEAIRTFAAIPGSWPYRREDAGVEAEMLFRHGMKKTDRLCVKRLPVDDLEKFLNLFFFLLAGISPRDPSAAVRRIAEDGVSDMMQMYANLVRSSRTEF